MNITKKKLKRFLRNNSPDSFLNGKPLICWCLDNEKLCRIILEHGADANLDFEMKPGLSVTPLFVTRLLIKKLNNTLESLRPLCSLPCLRGLSEAVSSLRATESLIVEAGGKSVVYREYIRLNIRD